MQHNTSIYSFGIGAIICNIKLPFDALTSDDYLLVFLFIAKAVAGGFLSVFTTDAYKKIKTVINKKKGDGNERN